MHQNEAVEHFPDAAALIAAGIYRATLLDRAHMPPAARWERAQADARDILKSLHCD